MGRHYDTPALLIEVSDGEPRARARARARALALVGARSPLRRRARRARLPPEFSAGAAFGLQSLSDIGAEPSLAGACSKVALLLMAFPRLRLLWSRDARATVELFLALKAGRPEPRLEAALAAGAELGAGDGDGGRNQPAIDALMRLPGVNATNYRAVVREVDSLAELATLPERRLATLIGTANAAQLHRFLHEAPPAE